MSSEYAAKCFRIPTDPSQILLVSAYDDYRYLMGSNLGIDSWPVGQFVEKLVYRNPCLEVHWKVMPRSVEWEPWNMVWKDHGNVEHYLRGKKLSYDDIDKGDAQ